MVRYSFLVRLSHPLLHAGLSRRLLDHLVRPRQHSAPYGIALTLPALVQIINKTTFVQFFNEAHIYKVLSLGSLCLGVRLR